MTATSTMLPTPVATIISTRVMAWQRTLIVFVDVIVQSIMRYHCSHFPLALDVAGCPVELYQHQFQIRVVTRGRADGGVANRERPVVNDSLICLRTRRIKCGLKICRDESVRRDLAPGVQPDRFHFLLKNLCGPE